MDDETSIYLDFCQYYLDSSEIYLANLNDLKKQIPTLENLFLWLSEHRQKATSFQLIQLILAYSTVLQKSYNHEIITSIIENCIQDSYHLNFATFDLCVIASRSFWALGNWTKAEKYLLDAIDKSKEKNSREQAHVYQMLGSLQMNKGDFQEALKSLDKSQQLFISLGDKYGETSIKSEKAAFFLDKGDYETAEQMYRDVGNFELSTKGGRSNQTLLMLGVVTRRLGKTHEALDYLNELLNQVAGTSDKNAIAVSTHHLAWAYLNLKDYKKALDYALNSRKLYKETNDIRGESDVDEQLGEIYQARRCFKQSEFHFLCCMIIREQLENKQGLASVSRRLARLYLQNRRPVKGIYYLIRSAAIYKKVGMLNQARLKRGFREIFLKSSNASYPR